LTAARRLARRLLEPRPAAARRLPLGPAGGIRLEADPHLSLDQWLGLFESELAPWVRRFCRPGTVCLDVGAYNAYYALTFAKLARAPVVSFEPEAEAVARSRRNLALNPELAPLIEIREAAVGARSGAGVVTLDDAVLSRLERRDGSARCLVKIDVEGGELEVLNGATRLLTLVRPHLIVETHSLELEVACGDALLAAGYAPRIVTQRKLLPQDRSWAGATRHNRWLVAAGR
jgi:hypothetical protein